MSIGEKLTAIAENEEKVYAAGEAAARSHCRSEHYVTTVVGDGGTALIFELPFAPDLLCVTGFHPVNHSQINAVVMLVADVSSMAYRWCVGSARVSSGGSDSYTIKPSTFAKKFVHMGDRKYALCDLPTAKGGTSYFSEGLPYVVTALKYTKQSMQERIEEYVLSLTGSGTASLGADAVNAAFTQEQWSSLIEQKPDWTFTLV